MAIKFFAELENTDKFLSVVGGLYSRHNLGAQQKRYVDLYLSHKNNFSVSDCDFFSSSGRIEVLGNHTDHNNGKVLAAAISLDTLACVTKTDDNYIKILSGGYPIFIVNVDKVLASEKERGTSVALVKGVCNWFKENDYKVGGFVATMVSDVIKGAGVSSSASFEVLIAEILNVLYNDGKMSAIEKAVASQYAEYFYFGKPCGLLDQSAIALGDVSYIDFKDPLKMQVKNYDLPFDDLDIVIVNAGGDHSDLTANYAAIRSEMEEVAGLFDKKVLREVDEDEFYASIKDLKQKVSGRAILRAMHFFEENKRVEDAVKALEKADEAAFLKAVNDSGESSYKMLQNCYPENDKVQSVPLALAVVKRRPEVKACRIHGGGFAGTIICFVEKSGSERFIEAIKPVFGENNIFNLAIRKVGATKIDF